MLLESVEWTGPIAVTNILLSIIVTMAYTKVSIYESNLYHKIDQ